MMLIPRVDQIRIERQRQKLSCRQVALLAHLPDNALSRIEARESKTVHPFRAEAIAKALGRPLEELFDLPDKQDKEIA